MIINQLNITIMTKIEIISELRRCNPENIKSLSVIYFNRVSRVRYLYDYQFTSHLSLDARRELAKVLLSLYKLRDYVDVIRVEYFPSDCDDDETIYRYFSNLDYVYSISDFIKSIKK